MLLPNVAMIQPLLSCIPNEAIHRLLLWKIRFRRMWQKKDSTVFLPWYSRKAADVPPDLREVLVEEESKEKGIFTGRTEYNLLVHFPGNESLLGKYVRVHLDECRGFYYLGTLEENK